MGTGSANGSAVFTCRYEDWLPPGAKVISVAAQLPASRACNVCTSGNPFVKMLIDSQEIGNSWTQVTLSSGCALTNYTLGGKVFDGGFPGYSIGGYNDVAISVTGWGIDVGSNNVARLDITYVPEPPYFALTPATPEVQRRILISKSGTEPYDSPTFQTKDREMDIDVSVVDIYRNPVAGQSVYFRAVDVSDPSAYVPSATVPDNIGALPLITPNPAVTDASGKARINLALLFNPVAGDNYQIEASLDPAIQSDPNYQCTAQCRASGIITVWKRVYLERDAMFRAGSFVTRPSLPNSVNVADVTQFSAGQKVRLVHAPRLDGMGSREFYSDDCSVASVALDPGRKVTTGRLNLTCTLAHTYDVDTSLGGRAGMADAVGILVDPTRHTTDSYFLTNESHVDRTFGDAFVEYRTVTSQFVSPAASGEAIPYTDVPFASPLTTQMLSDYANKWFQNATVNGASRSAVRNVKHVLAGSREPEQSSGTNPSWTLGMNDTSFSYTWLFGGRADDFVTDRASPGRVRLSGQRPAAAWTVNGEVVIHEFAHQFQVNMFPFVTYPNTAGIGHCSRYMRTQDATGTPTSTNSTTLFCTMNGQQTDTVAGTTQLEDGVIGFHYVDRNDSEYMEIRRAQDPVQQP